MIEPSEEVAVKLTYAVERHKHQAGGLQQFERFETLPEAAIFAAIATFASGYPPGVSTRAILWVDGGTPNPHPIAVIHPKCEHVQTDDPELKVQIQAAIDLVTSSLEVLS